MQTLAKIETAKVPAATAIAGVKTQSNSNVIPLDTEDRAYQRLGLIVLVLVFGIFALWSAFAPLGSYAMAVGRVVVDVKKQVIQHREGGIVEDIFVADGDHVEQGQKLMAISPTDAQAEQSISYEQLLGALGVEARLNAQLEGHQVLEFPSELTDSPQAKERAAEIMADESQQFKVSKAATTSEIVILQQRLGELKEQLQGTAKQIESQRALGASYAKEVGELQALFDRKLISKMQLNETERKRLGVDTAISELESQQASIKVQMGEAQQQLILQDNNRKKEVAGKLAEVRLNIADLRTRLGASSERLERTVLTAPKAGTVVNLAYHTKGGVVAPGASILEIVPKIDSFDVEAQVAVTDIDKVQPGLDANINFSAFGAASSFMQAIPGEVLVVSADTVPDKASGQQFYVAKVRIKPEGMADLAKHKLELVQGMPAEVMIKTGERTFLDYLLKPATSMINHAFNED